MTALPPDVSWDSPAPGAYTRMLRFGEWIGEPVTPLFESWLLTAMEDRMHAFFREEIGQIAPRPYHVVVNGWYFYSINFISGEAMLRSFPTMLVKAVRLRATSQGSFRRPFATAFRSSSGGGARTCSRATERLSPMPNAASRHCPSPTSRP